MRIEMTQRIIQFIGCPVCGRMTGGVYGETGHRHDCPLKWQRIYAAMSPQLPCPACRHGSVGFREQFAIYECRQCHSQFCQSPAEGMPFTEAEAYWFDDRRTSEDLFRVSLLPTKGEGDLPLDKIVADLQVEIDRQIAEHEKKSRRKRKKKGE